MQQNYALKVHLTKFCIKITVIDLYVIILFYQQYLFQSNVYKLRNRNINIVTVLKSRPEKIFRAIFCMAEWHGTPRSFVNIHESYLIL